MKGSSKDRDDSAVDGPDREDPQGTQGTDDNEPNDNEPGRTTTPPVGRPPIRRHLIVLAIGVVGLVVGIVLVLTGRSEDPPGSASTSTGPVAAAQPLPDLGAVDDVAAARVLIGDLDPVTLEGAGDPTTTRAGSTTDPSVDRSDVDLSETGLQRCQQAIAQQTTDRSLGSRRAAAQLEVGPTPAFVVSYVLPASGDDPAGSRILVADARTCRVLTAVEP